MPKSSKTATGYDATNPAALALVFLPAALGYAGVTVCPMDYSRPRPPLTPPGWVFSAVWPVLYLLMGLAWYAAAACGSVFSAESLAIAGIQAFLSFWTYVNSCRGRVDESAWVLGAACLATVFAIATSRLFAVSALLTPLAAWLAFATVLNFQQAAMIGGRAARAAEPVPFGAPVPLPVPLLPDESSPARIAL